MERSIIILALVAFASTVGAAPTANENFVIREDAKTYTNAVNAAKTYTDEATNATLAAAMAYADSHGGGGGGGGGGGSIDTNVVRRIAREEVAAETNNFVRKGLSEYQMNVTGAKKLYRSVVGTGYPYVTFDKRTGKNLVIVDKVMTMSGSVEREYPYLLANKLGWDFGGQLCFDSTTDDDGMYFRDESEGVGVGIFRDGGVWKVKSGVSGWSWIENEDGSLQDDLGVLNSHATSTANPHAVTAAQVGAPTTNQFVTLQGQVSTIGAHLNAEDARFVVTNYNSATRIPEAYMEIKLPDLSWSVIWREMTRWNWLLDSHLPTNYYTKTAVDAALAQKADRAWGAYDSETGDFAPDGFVWLSTPRVALAANLGYQRTITTEGSIWVLESRGVVTTTGGVSSNGFFRVSDDEGNVQFEIVKGDKRTIGADASSCQVLPIFTPTKLQIGYSVVSESHPTIYVTRSLESPEWKAETDADCIANVTWSGASGAYVATVQGKSAESVLFVKATYETGGETYVNNRAPVSMQSIIIGGTKYTVGTATISGHTVLTLTPGN